jgi:hypothetical protein
VGIGSGGGGGSYDRGLSSPGGNGAAGAVIFTIGQPL